MNHAAEGVIAHTPARRGFSIRGAGSWIVNLSSAYRDYRRFKSLDQQRLQDIGVTGTEQAQARFSSFLARSQE